MEGRDSKKKLDAGYFDDEPTKPSQISQEPAATCNSSHYVNKPGQAHHYCQQQLAQKELTASLMFMGSVFLNFCIGTHFCPLCCIYCSCSTEYQPLGSDYQK